MKIFISWSGDQSKAIASALNDWLPLIIQAVEPFYSPEIEKGARWSDELDRVLEGTRFGIICLTPDNLKSHWIHYEAGALSKTKDAMIWTFLYNLNPSDIIPPLSKFQHTTPEKDDFFNLVKTINNRLKDVDGKPLQENHLRSIFDAFWGKLMGKLDEVKEIGSGNSGRKIRTDRELLDEILQGMREQQGAISSINRSLNILNRISTASRMEGLAAMLNESKESSNPTHNFFVQERQRVKLENFDFTNEVTPSQLMKELMEIYQDLREKDESRKTKTLDTTNKQDS